MVWRDDDSIRFYQDTPDKRGVSELMINNVWGGSLYDNIGWVRSGKDGKGLVNYRPRKRIANAVTTMVGGGIADRRDGLGNTTPHIVYRFE